jgi:hypothetical protein
MVKTFKLKCPKALRMINEHKHLKKFLLVGNAAFASLKSIEVLFIHHLHACFASATFIRRCCDTV